jgi:riboflavin kinase/FMN adenylyltransferase
MRVFDNLSEILTDKNTVLTLGTFDGIHLGHQKIIEIIKKNASSYGGKSLLVTFDPHPRSVISNNIEGLKILSTLKEKIAILETSGIDNLFIIKFTQEFSQLTAEEFFKKYIINGTGLREIVIGKDHRFGKGRAGNVGTLRNLGKEFSFNVTIVDEVKLNSETISSTKIRKALNDGNAQLANLYLGRFYSFSGTVVEGDKRGRRLGFPTANIQLDNEIKLLPAIGIYAVEFITGGKKHYGLLSIGKRPTFYSSGKVIPEVYVYDFDTNIYGEYVTVNVIERIRGEEKFSTAEELIVQMNKDKEIGLEILSRLVN